MGLFSKRIAQAYGPTATMPLAVASPWAPTDDLTQFTVDRLFADAVKGNVAMTRDVALRIPGVKRAHGIHVKQFAGIKFRQMDDTTPTDSQPYWLVNSRSGVSPYHRMYGLGSDMFFNGWGCLGFDSDPSIDPEADCMHVPYGAWGIDPATGQPWINTDIVPDKYAAWPVVMNVGYGENGLLVDGIDTLRSARKIEAAYDDRLDNPVPLTVLEIPYDVWVVLTKAERKKYRENYIEGRRAVDGAVVLKPDTFGLTFPDGALGGIDLFESGRNAIRLDVANHTGTPASLLEGVSQGGSGGSLMKYTGVANGIGRNELWEFGQAKGFALAFEARMSLDDVSPSGLSIRGDLSSILSLPEPLTNPTSED